MRARVRACVCTHASEHACKFATDLFLYIDQTNATISKPPFLAITSLHLPCYTATQSVFAEDVGRRKDVESCNR